MKFLILSFLLILGLANQDYGKPINDIFSIKDPTFTEEAYVNDIPFDTYEIAVESILDGDVLKLEDEAYIDDIPFDTKAIAGKYLFEMKMKNSGETNINDLNFDTKKVFYEKLAARLTEQYRNEPGTDDIPGAPDDDFCCFEIRIPHTVSVIIDATVKQTIRQ